MTWLTLFFTCILNLSQAGESTPIRIEAAGGSQKPSGSVLPRLSAELNLKGSRAEVLNFQLRVTGSGCTKFESIHWKNKAASTLSVRYFEMTPFETTHASFTGAPLGRHYDPLPPLPNNQVCPNSGVAWVWGELEIPRALSPGEYEGTLSGKSPIKIHLTVWKMVIPNKPALPAYSELGSWFLLLGHYGEWSQGEERLSERYSAEMQRHRLYPVKSFIAKPEPERRGERWFLDLTNKPSAKQSFANVTLKNRPTDAYFDFPTIPPDAIDKPETAQYFEAIQNSLSDLRRPGKAFVYLWDEPEKTVLEQVKKLAHIAKTRAPDLKVLVTTPWRADLESDVDIFVPVMDQFDARGFPRPEAYRALQAKGKEVWWYVSCMSHGCDALGESGRPDFVIDRPSAWIRVIPWLSAKYALDGFLYYAVVNGYNQGKKRDPWKDLWDFSGNGDGTLFYPGRPGEHGFTEHQPVASIRLKVWREASYDAEYVRWMNTQKTKPAWWQKEFDALITDTKTWDHDYYRYQSLRDRAGEYLNSINDKAQ